MHSTIFATSRYSYHETQTPASILLKRRLGKQYTTTIMQTITSAPMRGDQPPQIDAESSDDTDEVVDGRNHPVTMDPIYSNNERDRTERRIA